MTTDDFKTARRWTEALAREALDACTREGSTLEEFAAAHELELQRLMRWQARLEQEIERPAPRMAIVRVVDGRGAGSDSTSPMNGARPATDGAVMELVLGEDLRIRVGPAFDEDALARLLRVVMPC